MDAGLVGLLGGVIGAAVGALCATASAWVTGRKAEQQDKILAEAQVGHVRLQIDADRTRALRESRNAAYVAFAEGWRLVHETLREADIKLGGIAASDPSEGRDERRQAARRLWNEAHALEHRLGRLMSTVYVEGPSQMQDASREASGALVPYFGAVLDWLHAIDNGTETPQHSEEAGRAGGGFGQRFLSALEGAQTVPLFDVHERRQHSAASHSCADRSPQPRRTDSLKRLQWS
ncbi:hypothetical protein OG987_40040 [Streptomyces sp. NBC_01620]|uniref:hypothetical protein n=1 Tax=Streptomyces sp. NBC_01620 TaxID=2975902 RepID=UPI003869DF89|nr:hypothetical protein OG987_40040 [Streptomyces sp. NBC_01620]